MNTSIERKLTTILAADAEGYSRLMEVDEVSAMTTLKESRAVFVRLIERHRGRIANTAGDGLIADFPSVVEAVQCAVEVQTELAARNRRQDPDRAMRFRVGVHLGDVMVDGGDLFGEGVNLAARLQSMAEPGGVLISQAVYDQVRGKLAIGYEFLGARQPKNLSDTVAVYRLLLDGGVATAGRGPPEPEARRPGAAAMATVNDAASASRGRIARSAPLLAIIWATLFAIDLFTGAQFWSVWPGIAILTILGLQAVPMLATGWLDVQLARCAVITAALALVNLASGPHELWFLWPAGALLVVTLLRRAWRAPR